MLATRVLRSQAVATASKAAAATEAHGWRARAESGEFDRLYSSKHLRSRHLPLQLRQSGDGGAGGVHGTGSRLLVDTRVRKGPFWHLSQEQGSWCYSVYNRMYHPRAYVAPDQGGTMQEYEWLTNDVTMWNVAVESQIMVKGPDAEKFVDMVITRRAALCKPMFGKYVILCNQYGGILNDPILLRPSADEFWFSLSDSTMGQVLQGVNAGLKMDVAVHEIDVSPVQIQGPKATQFMADLVGKEIEDVEYYGLMKAKINGCDVVISRTGWSTERGYEIYLYDAMKNAEKMWYTCLDVGAKHGLKVTAPGHHRRIEAGILSWGQDLDIEVNPYEVGLGWQVDLTKDDFIGKDALAKIKKDGVTHKLAGIRFGGKDVTWYIADFYHVKKDGEVVGYVTSAWFSKALQQNVGFAYLPVEFSELGTSLTVELPAVYNPSGETISAEVVKTPFKMPAADEMGTGLRTTGSKF